MSLRDDFEKLFPVPEGVKWDGGDYIYTRSKAQTMDGVTLGRYNDCWQGFQAGYAAGLEAAINAVAENEGNIVSQIRAIRAMKP